MLDTRFPRLAGDIGNPASFDCRVLYHRVKDASVSRIVTDQSLPRHLRDRFVNGARLLQRRGATIITTTCGFLNPIQHTLESAVDIPVVASSLRLLPQLRDAHSPKARFGILTFDEKALTASHLPDLDACEVRGLPAVSHLRDVIAQDLPGLDANVARKELIDSFKALLHEHPDLSAIVLECTNFSPYKNDLAAISPVPVLDIHDAIGNILNPSFAPDR